VQCSAVQCSAVHYMVIRRRDRTNRIVRHSETRSYESNRTNDLPGRSDCTFCQVKSARNLSVGKSIWRWSRCSVLMRILHLLHPGMEGFRRKTTRVLELSTLTRIQSLASLVGLMAGEPSAEQPKGGSLGGGEAAAAGRRALRASGGRKGPPPQSCTCPPEEPPPG
jgi:hypothetical protein